MAKPFDATTKQLVEINPQDWLALLGFPNLRVEVVDADLATVTTDADRILRALDPPISLFHLEFEAGRDATDAPRRAHRYNALAGSIYKLPIATVLFFLNPRAGRMAEVTGLYEEIHPYTGAYLQFYYRAIRIWELPVQELLTGGVAVVPPALLSNTTGFEPAQVIEAVYDRVVTEAAPDEEASQLLSASYILAGLRFSDTIVQTLFEGVPDMEESSTYQAILTRGMTRGMEAGIQQGLREGHIVEARRMLTLAGESRLGEPSPATLDLLASIDSLTHMEGMMRRLYSVETWGELLAS